MAGFLKEKCTPIYHLFFERIHQQDDIGAGSVEFETDLT